MKLRAPLLLLLLAASLGAAPARADDESASTQLFNVGRDLMKQGDYSAACPKLAESVRLKASVGALAKLATCEEHEKRLVSAYTRWQQALNLARASGDDRATDVARELARLDGLVPKLTVTAAGTLPPDAVILVDGTAFGPASLGVPLPLEPGAHQVQATAPGKKPWSTSVTLASGGATTPVTVPSLEDAPVAAPAPLPPAPAASVTPAPPVPPPPAPAPSAHASSAWPVVGLVAAGAGALSLIAGGAFGLDAMSQRNDAHCQGTTCPDATSASKLGDARTAADWSTGLLVTGGVLAAGGLTVWLVARDHGEAVHVGAAPAPGGVVVSGWWR